MGSRVLVTQIIDRRAKIDAPIKGWVSRTSSNGDTILSLLPGEKETWDPHHFSPGVASSVVDRLSHFICEELNWIQGKAIFTLILDFLTDPKKTDTQPQPCKTMEMELEVTQIKNDKIARELKDSEMLVKNLMEENESLKKSVWEMREFQTENEKLKREKAGLESENENLKKEKAGLESENETLKKELEALSLQLSLVSDVHGKRTPATTPMSPSTGIE